METKLKIYGIVAEDEHTYYVRAKDEKEAFWKYMKYLGNCEPILKKAESVLSLSDLIELFNEYNHQGYKILCLFYTDLDNLLFGNYGITIIDK